MKTKKGTVERIVSKGEWTQGNKVMKASKIIEKNRRVRRNNVSKMGASNSKIWDRRKNNRANGMEECHMLRLEAALLMPHIDIVMCCGFEI